MISAGSTSWSACSPNKPRRSASPTPGISAERSANYDSTCSPSKPGSPTEVPLLERMHHKRRRILHRRGFRIVTAAPGSDIPVVAQPTSQQTSPLHHTPAGPAFPATPPSAAEVRAWAKQQGINVPSRGKLSKVVLDEYYAAHPVI